MIKVTPTVVVEAKDDVRVTVPVYVPAFSPA
jgi:hypothetical protein